MRIISQDKEFDLPYEETALQVFPNGTIAAFSLTDLESNAYITMAKYSTEEKAIKAMEMCRVEYGKYYSVSGGTNAFTGATIQPGVFTYPKVFQFPTDEEVKYERKI